MGKEKKSVKVMYVEPDDYFPKEIREKYGLGEFAVREDIKKIKAVMLGHAIGDALGVPVEFCSREKLLKEPVADMMGYGTYPVPAGAWSDDTGMSLAALDSMADGKIDFEEIMTNFVKWFSLDKYTPTGAAFDIGHTCLNAIRNHLEHPELPATECGMTDEYANGNGSLMRIHPFVLFAHATKSDYWQWMGLVKAASSLTHAHERAMLGCTIYGYCLEFLLTEATKDSLRRGLQHAGEDLRDHSELEHFARLFDPAFECLAEDEIRSTGYVVDTLEAALWCVLTTDSYRECVLKAVNLGDDTDTVAAVAGGLAGALYGYEAIPKEWLDTLIKREWIEEMCEKAGKQWGT